MSLTDKLLQSLKSLNNRFQSLNSRLPLEEKIGLYIIGIPGLILAIVFGLYGPKIQEWVGGLPSTPPPTPVVAIPPSVPSPSPTPTIVDTLKPYERTIDEVKISMQYPQSWGKRNLEYSDFSEDVARFFPNEENPSEPCITELVINIENLPPQPITLSGYQQLAKKRIEELNNKAKIKEISTEDILAKRGTYKLIYTNQDVSCSLKVMEVGMLNKDKAYYITYRAELRKYDQFLKPVEEMIKSFEVTEVNNK